ncbi:VanW family protein [Shouchella patagoniensis]|uniref:VanW family protein n=1 Tax=Shouchella patagoniensis TaxID=228576 RepID=UPI0009956D34|nr:VanW family protein [Shouchella patagoniensis]
MKQLLTFIAFISIIGLSACGQVEAQVGSFNSTKNLGQKEKQIPDLSIAVYDGDEQIDLLPVESINEEYLKEWAGELARGENGYDQAMRPAKWRNGELIGGKDQVILYEAELIEKILQLPVWERNVVLPVERQEIAAKVSDIGNMNDKVIGKGKTRFDKSVGGRMENIRLSTESIDYVVLGSGDTFTFNGVTGERTLENGYKEATVIMDGDFVDGVGGGICQTSTTLYNAVLDAGLTVIERHPHSLPISYVEEGLDAMVNWGTADLRFRNDFDYPVVIRGGINQEVGEVWFEVRS